MLSDVHLAGQNGRAHARMLRRDDEYTVLRSDAERDGDTLLIVATGSEQPPPRSVERLRHEHALRDSLHAAWAAKPLTLEEEHGRSFLVLADPGGELLSGLIGEPWDTGAFLRVAIGISVALGRVHAQGLIHKDVKPDHVLVDLTSGAAWLTGFGIASRLARERQAPDLLETIAGTLAYMAPEQTGRMNRSVDARSDLYALGVTFYQMLTGELPFTASDPMELVHCHIARQPVPPAERAAGVPPVVSDIVMKLLAKTAEDRYQTAAGASADLRRCLERYEASGAVEAFALGAQDIPDVLRIPEKLYGREKEVGALLAAFERVVSHGTPELLLISGYSGVGKSSVVNELHKSIVPPRGLFAAGKFDQYQRDVPYATLAQAFRGLVRQLLAGGDADIALWRAALAEALGVNGQLMVNLVPELELLIGPQPPIAELPPQEAQSHFQRVFRRMVGVFARAQHPLVLFLDDLQWLDAASFNLLTDLATQPDLQCLLLVGAYRDNEVDASHPLVRCLREIRIAGGAVQEIVLAPLGCDDVRVLVADSLHCERPRAAPLAQLIFEKTGGNPFFAMQFLTALAEESLLVFDHEAADWAWDLPRIRAKGYTENVADLMAAKLGRLPDVTRAALGQLACLGNVAALAMLAIVHGGSEEKLHAGLWEAVRAGFVFRSDGAYAFAHDRVHEAAYALIPGTERAAAHLRIGRLLESRLSAEQLEESIFDVANHLNRGAALITGRPERVRAAELNLMAGKRAKGSTAYESALSYLLAGRELLDEESWNSCHALMFALELQLAECEFLTGNARAEARLAMLAGRACDLVEAAAVACLRQVLYTTVDRLDRSVEVGLDYLRGVGVDWTPHPAPQAVLAEYERMLQQLEGSSIERMAELPHMRDPQCRAIVDVLTELVPGAYFTDVNLVCLVVCRIANLGLEHGNSNGTVYAYSLLGFLLRTRFGDQAAGFKFGKLALQLCGERGLDRFRARVYLNFAYCVNPWSEHIQSGRHWLRCGLAAAHETGDLTFAGYLLYCLMTDLIASGDPLDQAQREAELGLEFASKARFGLVKDILTGHLGLIRALRGTTTGLASFSDAQFDEEAFERHLQSDPGLANPTCVYWIRKLQACVLAGEHERAVAAAAKAQPLLWTSPASFETADFHFYAALAHAGRGDLAPLSAHHRQIAAWAGPCPANFENREALLAAEIARIERRDLDAMRLYENAIRSAQAQRFVHNGALAAELAGRFYLERGLRNNGLAHLRDARAGYASWGAEGKLRQLDDAYPALRQAVVPASSTSPIGAPIEQLDLASVLKMSQAVSGEIVLERLIEKLMTIALEHAGAQRGLLIVPQGEVPYIEARAAAVREEVELSVQHARATPADLPESVLRYVLRTRESVLLEDAAQPNPYSSDPYLAARRSRSVLCLPLLKQARLIGVLYLENALVPHAFTSSRIGVLELLASQAAISLQNARLYMELQQENSDRRQSEAALHRSEERYALAVDATGDGHTDWIVATDEFYASPRLLRMLGLPQDARFAGRADFLSRLPIHPEDRDRVVKVMQEHYAGNSTRLEFGMRILRRGEVRWMHATQLCLRAPAGALLRVSTAVTDVTEARSAEEALRRSEARKGAVLDTALDCVIAMDENGRIVDFNTAAERTFGVLRSEALGRDLADLIIPRRQREAHRLGLARFLETRETKVVGKRLEFAALRADGSEFPVELAVAATRVGGDWLFTAYLRDITERRSIEEELHESEQKYRTLFDSIDEGFCTIEVLFDENAKPVDYRFLQVNPSFERQTGIKNAVGRRMREIAPQHEEHWFEIYGKIALTGEPMRFENEAKQLGRWYDVYAFRLEDPKLRRVGILFNDITERKRAEEELRARQEMLDLAQKAARAVAFEWRRGAPAATSEWPVSWTVRVSAELEGIFGVAPGSFDGSHESWKKLVHPEDWAAVNSSLAVAGQTGEMSSEYRVVIPGGAPRWVQSKGRMLFDSQGEPERLVGFVLDVTEKHTAEEELRRLEKQLRQAQRLEALGTLAAGIAHDFNNILGAILGFSEMVARDAPKGSRLGRDVDAIIVAGERGRALVDKIIAFSSSRSTGERVAVHVEKVVREALDLVAAKLPEGVRIDAKLSAGPAATRGDPTQVHQVLLNLATNAVHAMHSGGTLCVALELARVDTPRLATVGTLEPGEYIALTVRDTGTGMSPEVLERMFDPFFTTKETGTGTGLGLSLVHGIVADMNGAIDVTSTLGAGTEFIVYLPRTGDAGDSAEEDSEPVLPRGAGERVLVVDDEEPLMRLAARTLEELGYAPSGFTSSAAALEAFRSEPAGFDAVITDERMPGMVGTALIREVRGIRGDIPVLLVSGFVGGAVASAARKAGADEVLKKPLLARDLATSLARILQRR